MPRSAFIIIFVLLVFLSGCTSLQEGIDIRESDYPHLVDSSRVARRQEEDLVVLQFNIWQEGTVVPGGFDAIVDEIVRSDADLVTLSEVRNYRGTSFIHRLIAALELRGSDYYGFESEDSGLLSRFEIIEHSHLYPVRNDRGSITKAVVRISPETELAFYSAHLDYRACAYYDVLGYDGSTWRPRDPVTDPEEIQKINLSSKRDDAVEVFLYIFSEIPSSQET